MSNKEKQWAVYSSGTGPSALPEDIVRLVKVSDETAYVKFSDAQIHPDPYYRTNLREFNSILGAVGYFVQRTSYEHPFNIVRRVSGRFSNDRENLEKFLKTFDGKK